MTSIPKSRPSGRHRQPDRPDARGRLDENLSRPRVLFIDDEPIICRSIGRCLERFGFRVAVAMSGEAALDQLGQTDFDVIVSDVQMPGMGGIELISKILSSWPRMAGRILITSGDVGSDAARALVASTGCVAMQKPFPLAELIAAIRDRLPAAAA